MTAGHKQCTTISLMFHFWHYHFFHKYILIQNHCWYITGVIRVLEWKLREILARTINESCMYIAWRAIKWCSVFVLLHEFLALRRFHCRNASDNVTSFRFSIIFKMRSISNDRWSDLSSVLHVSLTEQPLIDSATVYTSSPCQVLSKERSLLRRIHRPTGSDDQRGRT